MSCETGAAHSPHSSRWLGPRHNLADWPIAHYSVFSETTEDYVAPDDYSWGGDGLGAGTIEVLEVEESEVRFRIAVESLMWGADPDGEYTALSCP